MSWFGDAYNFIIGSADAAFLPGNTISGQNQAATGAAGVQTGINDVGDTGQVIGAVWGDLSNGKLWRSLGWLLLGIVLMFVGVALWIGPSAARRSPLEFATGALD